MTKQIREYLEHLRLFLDGEHSREEYVQKMKASSCAHRLFLA